MIYYINILIYIIIKWFYSACKKKTNKNAKYRIRSITNISIIILDVAQFNISSLDALN